MKETKFKQTEVGMIPSDWEVKTLGDIFDFSAGGDLQKECFSEYPFGTIKWPIFSNSLENKGLYGYTSNPRYRANCVTITGRGSLGHAEYRREAFDAIVRLLVLSPKQHVDCYFVSETINFRVPFVFESTGVPQLTAPQAAKSKIPLPPTIEEQQCIANALSDVDTLIANLEKLIAKKKNIKQGAMQQLLTGRKRLPGFGSDERRKECHSERSAKREVEESSGYKMTELGLIPSDWEVKKIGDFTKLQAGGTPSTLCDEFWGGNIRWMNSGELNNKRIYDVAGRITELGLNNSSTHLIPSKCVLVGLAGQGKTRGTAAINYVELCTNQSIAAMFPSKTHNSEYLYHTIDNRYEELRELSSGDGGRGGLNLKILANLFVALPSKAEQTAIANVLSDMDTEISALETKLAKYRTLKTGMMQQLLTGKIRLVDAKSETKSVENNRVVPVAFRRAVLAAEIAHRLCAEPTFGHVKMEKMLFLAEKMCELDINSSYHRDAAGPYDNRALRSVDSQLEKQKWFKFIHSDKGNHYIPLEKRGGHSQYFERYYSECRSVFDNIINTFKTAKTEQCEIVATLYSAWEDFLNQGTNPTDDQIVTEVLTNWNESKKRISKERWIKALSWMKENKFTPLKQVL